MQRSSIALAALATVAVPGLDVHHALSAPAANGFQAAVAVDSEDRQWLVQAPTTAAAGAAAESEIAYLTALAPLVDQGTLPFVVPRAVGFAPLAEGGRAVVFRRMVGSALNLDRLAPGPGAAASLGRAIAAIHELPISLAENTGHPSYTADDYRRRHLAQLDEAAQSGKVPAFLLRRWESALENVALWRFTPVITHGSLTAEAVIMSHGQVSAIVDWTGVQVADPADDLSWLVAGAPAACVDSILEAYQLGRTELIDPHLVDRAQLLSELALVKWLQHGVRSQNRTIIADAMAMMSDLVEATTETGTFTVSAKLSQAVAAAQETGTDRVDEEPAAISADLDTLGTATSASEYTEQNGQGHSEDRAELEFPQDDLPDGTMLPNYDRATPPGPHADDPTTVLQTVDPDDY